jgi:hypothetical protein
MTQLIYAGIGSRKTPLEVLNQMTSIAEYLGNLGAKLRSGHADGADKAFERGALNVSGSKEIHLPWDGYNNTRATGDYIVPTPTPDMAGIAAAHHPVWLTLKSSVKTLMLRNTTIVLGPDLATPVQCVIGWTEGGRWIGGTSHAFRVAHAHNIPIYNLATELGRSQLTEFVALYEKHLSELAA